jgi:hypothetical protein
MPINDAQKTKHWNTWGKVCAVNQWRMARGKLYLYGTFSAEGGYHERVLAAAREIAERAARQLKVDDLRKGLYAVALGEVKSLTAFNNGDLDRVLVLFALLINPLDLRSVGDFLAYQKFDAAKCPGGRPPLKRLPVDMEDPGERRRHLHAVDQVPQAYWLTILRARFHVEHPEDLTLDQLRQFTTTLKNRRAYADRPAMNQPPSRQAAEVLAQSENEPF